MPCKHDDMGCALCLWDINVWWGVWWWTSISTVKLCHWKHIHTCHGGVMMGAVCCVCLRIWRGAPMYVSGKAISLAVVFGLCTQCVLRLSLSLMATSDDNLGFECDKWKSRWWWCRTYMGILFLLCAWLFLWANFYPGGDADTSPSSATCGGERYVSVIRATYNCHMCAELEAVGPHLPKAWAGGWWPLSNFTLSLSLPSVLYYVTQSNTYENFHLLRKRYVMFCMWLKKDDVCGLCIFHLPPTTRQADDVCVW